MDFRVRSKRISARAQAGFVALLYVFLCTFGTWTHAHLRHGGEEGACILVASANRVTSRQNFPILHAYHDPVACAFCEWQAHSVSTALPLFAGLHPALMCPLHQTQVVASLAVPVLASPSSRAPPAA